MEGVHKNLADQPLSSFWTHNEKRKLGKFYHNLKTREALKGRERHSKKMNNGPFLADYDNRESDILHYRQHKIIGLG